jgi:hypothetical protein
MRSTQRFLRVAHAPLKLSAGETANFTCRHQRFAASSRFERCKGRLRLALRLAGEVVDGGKRREFSLQAAQSLGIARIGGGDGRKQGRVIRAAIEQGVQVRALGLVAAVEQEQLARTVGALDLVGDPGELSRAFVAARQQIDAVAQGDATQRAQRAPDAHAACRLPARQADEKCQEIHWTDIQVLMCSKYNNNIYFITLRPCGRQMTKSPFRHDHQKGLFA